MSESKKEEVNDKPEMTIEEKSSSIVANIADIEVYDMKVKDKPESKVVSSVGQELRKIREEKNITIEEVSSKLKIKIAQLEAIEKNDIDKLPGMTYGVGFVKGYANYLGLNGLDIAARFKKDNSQRSGPVSFSFPEPLDEGQRPNTITIGIVSFLAILLLVAWTAYSNMQSNKDNLKIESIPTVEEFSKKIGMPILLPPTESNLIQVKEVTGKLLTEEKNHILANNVNKKTITLKKNIKAKSIVKKINKKTAIKRTKIKSKVLPERNIKKVKAVKPKINIDRSSNNVVLLASHASWVQVTDKDKNVIFRKVLRAGDRYFVPDIKGLSLVTANAGGLDIFVKGKKIPSLGSAGEIVRGVSLDARLLKKR